MCLSYAHYSSTVVDSGTTNDKDIIASDRGFFESDQ